MPASRGGGGSAEPGAPPPPEDAAKARNLLVLYFQGFAVMANAMLLMTSTPMLVAKGFGGDRLKTVSTMTSMMSASAVLEFILNPLAGGLSDAFGRKPFLLLNHAVGALLRFAAWRRPTLRNVVLHRVITSALIPTSMTAVHGAIADMNKAGGLDAAQLAGINGRIRSMIGLSMIVGSLLGGRLAGRDVVLPFRVSFFTSLAALAVVAATFRETLQPADRRPPTLRTGSPLRFLSLFQRGALFARVNAMHALLFSPFWTQDISQAYAQDVRGWGPEQRGRFQSLTGLAGMFQGALTGRAVTALGPRYFTMLSSALSCLANCLWANSKSSPIAYAALVADTTKMSNSSGDVLGAQLGAAKGLGRGEMAAARANLDAVVKIIVPLVYGKLYAVGTRNGIPGLPFYAAAALSGAGGVVSASTRDGDWAPAVAR